MVIGAPTNSTAVFTTALTICSEANPVLLESSVATAAETNGVAKDVPDQL